jgi:hypothetical protein
VVKAPLTHLGPLVAEQPIALALLALGAYLFRGVRRTPAPVIPPAEQKRA